MIRGFMKSRRRRLLLDIGTQKDFFLASGNACIRNHRRILANVRRVIAWARVNRVPIISICEVYSNDNSGEPKKYCLDGTEGQNKIHYSLLSGRVSFPADSFINLPHDVLRHHRQLILHERSWDAFNEPLIERLLSEIRVREFIVIGANTDEAVQAAVLGLIQRQKRVTVVCDAVGSRNLREAKMAFRKMKAKGATLTETRKLAGTSHLQLVGTCDCPSCKGRNRKRSVKLNVM